MARLRSVFVLASVLASAPASALPPELVPVGAPGNAGDPGGSNRGAVAYEFEIGRYEVTNEEYAAFLNAVAREDPHGLWVPLQGSSMRGGITRSGSPGNYVYTVKPGFERRPVVYVSFRSAARFANWLHHGMPTGPDAAARIESGSYDPDADEPTNRLPGATWVVPTHHEWYKAAYYYPGGVLGGPTWFDYATGSNVAPTQAVCSASGEVTNPGANVAVWGEACNWNGTTTGNYAEVGTAGGPSPFGTYDQTGNASELVARAEYPGVLVVGGGTQDANVSSTYVAGVADDNANGAWGFRVAYLPEPDGAGAAAAVALAALAARARSASRRRLAS